MKRSMPRLFIFVLTLIAITLISNVRTNSVKADAAFKGQQGVVIRSASLTTDKVIVVPQKNKDNGSSKTLQKFALSRGGSSIIEGGAGPSDGNNNVVAFASKFLGTPYVWGASGPRAFDCSGFTAYVYKSFGVSLDHYTGAQFGVGQAVSRANLAPGDLVFFNTYGSISHVGIYIGSGNFIHAGNERTGVTISSLSEGYYLKKFAGARRILN